MEVVRGLRFTSLVAVPVESSTFFSLLTADEMPTGFPLQNVLKTFPSFHHSTPSPHCHKAFCPFKWKWIQVHLKWFHNWNFYSFYYQYKGVILSKTSSKWKNHSGNESYVFNLFSNDVAGRFAFISSKWPKWRKASPLMVDNDSTPSELHTFLS